MNELSEAEIKQEKKNKAIGITIGLILVLIVSISASYAYWTLTATQDDTNSISTACLKLTMESTDTAISLESTYPLSDFEGMQTEGYTFTVTNECDKDIDYRIDLDSLKLTDETKRLSSSSVAVLLDYGSNFLENNEIATYADMESVETTDSTLFDKKALAYDTVLAGETNNHTVRIWVDESSTIEDASKDFQAKVSITAGQGIEKEYTDGSCFTFDTSTGTISDYDVDTCGTDVVIPYEIDGVKVTTIGNEAFKNNKLTSIEIPRTITSIGNYSFFSDEQISTLKKFIVKDGLVTIGTNEFSNGYAYNQISYLHNIIIPSTVNSIGVSAFLGCGIERLVIPDTVTTIGSYAFEANRIKELKIGNGIASIPEYCFAFNEIEDIVIPDNITTLGSNCFANNPIKSIKIGSGVTSMDKYVFYSDTSRIDYTNVTIPDVIYVPSNVTTLNDTFFNYPSTTTIVFDNCVDDITFNGTFEEKETVQLYSFYVFKTDGCSAE